MNYTQVINAAPDVRVDLQRVGKPLTLNMEFEMTRPMLDFLIRLHKNGEDPSSMVHLTTIEHEFHFESVLFSGCHAK